MSTKSPGGPGPSAPNAVGDQIAVKPFGPYYLVRKLAEGGMAEIFLAKQVGVEGFEKNVVIKRMLAHLTTVSDFVTMFLDEARLATRLAHPNIVQINDLGLKDGCYYICMEYLAGEDFSTVVRAASRRGEFVPLHVTLRTMAEAAHGLHFAHEFRDAKGSPLNVVHRDVSPSNIFITYTGQVKVLDFGIARAESRVTQTTAGVVKGKYQYMSPEQARGLPVDRRSDVYSLGVSLYEALTNTRPFARDSDLAILNAVLTSDYRPPRALRPELPEELERVVIKALSRDANDRHQSAREFAEDLERYLQAATSNSGGSSLANFMAGFFGPARVASKTRIETLPELAARGIDVPGFTNPLAPRTEPGTLAKPDQPADRRWKSLALILLAGVLVGVGALVARRVLAPTATVQPIVPAPFDAGVAVVEAPVDAGVVAAVIDAGPAVVEAVVDAGLVPVVNPPRVVPTAPVVLTEQVIMKVVRARAGAVAQCFQQFKGDLPDTQGQLRVEFTVVSSGKVTQVKSPMEKLPVGKCVDKVVRTLVFPRHKDAEVGFTLPLAWNVK